MRTQSIVSAIVSSQSVFVTVHKSRKVGQKRSGHCHICEAERGEISPVNQTAKRVTSESGRVYEKLTFKGCFHTACVRVK